jgi:hypothetical protein
VIKWIHHADADDGGAVRLAIHGPAVAARPVLIALGLVGAWGGVAHSDAALS